MKKPSSAFTLIELLVVISIIAILAALATPAINNALVRGQMTQTLNNMKQLHLATQQMALDGTTTGATDLGWPADIGGTWSAWATALVENDYIKANDFARMLSAPGVIRGTNTAVNTATPTAINAYNVSENSPGDTVFLATANWTDGQQLNANTKPYGDKGFIVFRKGADGVVLKKNQATNTTIIGTTTNKLQ